MRPQTLELIKLVLSLALPYLLVLPFIVALFIRVDSHMASRKAILSLLASLVALGSLRIAGISPGSHIMTGVTIVALICGIACVWPTGRIGVLVFVLGATSNRVVVAANGGRMPALDAVNEFYIPMSEATFLNFLGDWVKVWYSLMSIGDIFVAIGGIISLGEAAYYKFYRSSKRA